MNLRSLVPCVCLLALPLLVACDDDKGDIDDFDNSDAGGLDGLSDGSDGGGDSSGDGSDGSGDGSDGGSDGGDGSDGSDGGDLDGDPTDCDLDGQAWVLDLSGARFVEPAGVGDLLLGSLEGDITVGVSGHSGDEVDLFMGITEGEQDLCQETSPVSGDFDDPVVRVGPTTFSMSGSGVELPIESFRLAFVVESGCSSFRDGILSGQLDARTLAPVLGELLGTTDPDAFCDLMSSFGASCGDCNSDGEEMCIDVLITDIPGEEAPFSFQEWTASDVAGESSCF